MSGMQFRIVLVLTLVVTLALGFLGWRLLPVTENLLNPAVEQKAETVGRNVANLVGLGLGYGIPLDQLARVDGYLSELLAANEEIAAIAVADITREPVFEVTREGIAATGLPEPIAIPLNPAQEGIAASTEETGTASGFVLVWIDPGFARGTLFGLGVDLAIITLVSVLMALELVGLCFGAGLYSQIEGVDRRVRDLQRQRLLRHEPLEPRGAFGELAMAIDRQIEALQGRYTALKSRLASAASAHDTSIQDRLSEVGRRFAFDGKAAQEEGASVIAVRAPLFLFMFAEELTRPFLPAMIGERADNVPPALSGLSPEVLIGLPFFTCLAAIALAQPVVGPWSEKNGRLKTILIGAVLGAIGHLTTALAPDLLTFAAARTLTGIGFAMIFIGAQGFILDRAESHRRGRNLAGFIGAILAAGLCGPPIGGLLADRLSHESVMVIAGCLALLSGIVAQRALASRPPPIHRAETEGADASVQGFVEVLRSAPLMGLFVLAALPAKLVLTGFAFFMVPLSLDQAGYDPAIIGRVMMIYPVAMVLLVPIFGRLADRMQAHGLFVGGGAIIFGVGAYVAFYGQESGLLPPLEATILASAALGLGQALSIAPQSALVAQWGGRFAARVTTGTVFGIFRLIERAGAAIAPLIAATALATFGFAGASQFFAISVGGAGAVFLLIWLTTLHRPAPITQTAGVKGDMAE